MMQASAWTVSSDAAKSYPVRRTDAQVQRCESAGSIAYYMHVDS
jgi:hypothetical protein